MRTKDENKRAAITKAILRLINEIGFANTSMSKIAKATGLLASTLYVYYENKEDMFRKIYLDVKKQMIAACSSGLSEKETLEQSVRRLCRNLLCYMQAHTDEFLFLEQACNSPLVTDAMMETVEEYNRTAITIFQRGIEQGILKPASPALLLGFCAYPIQQIFKETQKEKTMLPDVDFDQVFQMCWDAIKR
mgnify:FL=1